MSSWRLVAAPLAALVLSLAAVLAAARWPVPRPLPPRALSRRTLPAFLRYVMRLAIGGYLALLVIVLVFGVVVVGDRRAFPESVIWGAFLVGVAVPAFVVLTWLEGRLRAGRRATDPTGRTSAPGGGTGGAR